MSKTWECSRCGAVNTVAMKACIECDVVRPTVEKRSVRNDLVVAAQPVVRRCAACGQPAEEHSSLCADCNGTSSGMLTDVGATSVYEFDSGIGTGPVDEFGVEAGAGSLACLVPKLRYVSGHGNGLAPGAACELQCWSEHIVVRARSGDVYRVNYTDVVSLDVGGPGMMVKGGGFIGGGSGVVGAAGGMLTAAALNKLTTRKKITTFVRLVTYSSSYVFMSKSQTPDELDLVLTPVLSLTAGASAEAAARALEVKEAPAVALPPPVAPAVDVVDQLKRIGELHELGILDDDEFRRAKAALLSSLES